MLDKHVNLLSVYGNLAKRLFSVIFSELKNLALAKTAFSILFFMTPQFWKNLIL